MTIVALCALFGGDARAQSHEMVMHHGVPSRVVDDQRVGPYLASVWIEPEVGDGTVYVMLDAADGLPFTPPSAVLVAFVPTSGRLAEVVQEAHPEPLRGQHGGRYMTKLTFDRPDRWKVRVIVDGSAGGRQLAMHVESASNASLGRLGVILGSIPFLLVGFVYWRSCLARRRSPRPLATAPALLDR